MVRSSTASPVLADAANVLSDQLRTHLRRVAGLLKPHVAALDRRFQARLQELGLGPKQRTALAALTPGAAARIVSRGRQLRIFLEQVEYNGRRLAKLNLPPTDVVEALSEYDRLLTPVVRRLMPDEYNNFQWVRQQLHFIVILTLNRAYYQVRETEAEAFYELFRAELEARNLDGLLQGALEVLARFCGAQEAHFFLLDEERSAWVKKATVYGNGRRRGKKGAALPPIPVRAFRRKQLGRLRSVRTSGRSAPVLLDESWSQRFGSAWSVPLMTETHVAGVMQFAFAKWYDWLPREQELLQAAAERCLVAAEKARLVENLAMSKEQIRRLAEHMLHIEEVERRRISSELHDEAGQSLLYVRLQLEMLEKDLPDDLSKWKKEGEPSEVHLIAHGAAQPPAIHAAALENQLFASLQLPTPYPSWSEIVRDPTKGRAHVHIANGDGQRRVLGQVQILRNQGRDDHPHGLRQDH